MEFFRTLAFSFIAGTPAFSVLLFLLSASLLVAGVLLQARARIRLAHLEHTPLDRIERTHPHLPSPRAVAVIVFCGATLLLAGLEIIRGIFPFDDPYQGLNLLSFFLIGASLGVLAELRWKGAGVYAAAALAGTAAAFLCLIDWGALTQRPFPESVAMLGLLLPSLLLLGTVFSYKTPRGALLTAILAFAFWLLLSVLQ